MAYIFISYRRRSSTSIAHYLAEQFKIAKFDYYFDVDMPPEVGALSEQVLRGIDACTVFVCLLEADTLDSDWVRREIDYAHSLGKPCIPLLQENFIMPEESIGDGVTALLGMRGYTLFDRTNHFFAETVQQVIAAIRDMSLVPLTFMPPVLRVLIIEDDSEWVEFIQEALALVTSHTEVVHVDARESAVMHIQTKVFDVAIVDMDLHGENVGLELARMIRQASASDQCGIVWYTRYGTDTTTDTVFKFQPIVVGNKRHPNRTQLASQIKQAIREIRLHDAHQNEERAVEFTFQFQRTQLRVGGVTPYPQIAMSIADFADVDYRQRLVQAQMNESAGVDGASTVVTNLGHDLRERLLTDASIRRDFDQARVRYPKEMVLSIGGDPIIQAIPFEVLRVEGQIGSIKMPIVRRLPGSAQPRPPFSHAFIEHLTKDTSYFHIMLVGRKGDMETEYIHRTIATELDLIGVSHVINIQNDVQSCLDHLYERGTVCHMLHLTHNAGRELNAGLFAAFSHLLEQSKMLRFVYANIYLPEYTWDLLHAAVVGGAPSALTYQLEVSEAAALRFAVEFYKDYFRSFSVRDSVLRARQNPMFREFDKLAALCIDSR